MRKVWGPLLFYFSVPKNGPELYETRKEKKKKRKISELERRYNDHGHH